MTNLLAQYAADDNIEAGELWKEYALAFKGQRQLVWSNGLKKLTGVKDMGSDEALAADVSESDRLLANLTLYQWKLVREKKLRAQLLNVASHGSGKRLYNWLVQKGVM